MRYGAFFSIFRDLQEFTLFAPPRIAFSKYMVPGMSQYGESQEFSQIGIAVENDDDLPQPMDWEQESTKSNTDFSPTTK